MQENNKVSGGVQKRLRAALGILVASVVGYWGYGQWQSLEAEVVQRNLPAALLDIEHSMIVIEGGSFWMGSPPSQENRKDDEREHRVSVNKFKLSVFEVTKSQYGAFVAESGYRTDAERNAGENSGCYVAGENDDRYRAGVNWRNASLYGQRQEEDHPVVCISWNDAMAFIDWLNDKTNGSYRLPTESEWEYAARSGSQASYSFGNEINALCTYANGADETKMPNGYVWNNKANCLDGYAFTSPVGRFRPNAWGLQDMLGNAWEWTCSGYSSSFDGSEQECATVSYLNMSMRGGAWFNVPENLRLANRFGGVTSYRDNGGGFRLAQDIR